MIGEITDINAYLELLDNIKDHYLICIAMQENWEKEIDKETGDGLKKVLNCETDFDREYDFSYCAVLYGGRCYESRSDTEYSEISISLEEMDFVVEVSVVSKDHLSKETDKEPGVIIDGQRYAFFIRGISIVLYDIVNSCLVDSVTFDTGRKDMKAVRPFKTADNILNKLIELYGGFGYTIAQFLYDSGVTSLSVYAEPGFDELVRAVLLPMALHRKMNIIHCFSTDIFTLKFLYDGTFPRQKFEKFSCDKVPSNIPVLILTPFCNSQIKQALKKADIKIYEISDLVLRAVRYIKNEQAVLKKISEVPGVIAVSYSKPRKETCYNTQEHKRLLKQGYSTDKIYNFLKNGSGYPYISKAIEEADHSVEEWAELMCKPLPKQYVDDNGYIKFYDKSGKYVNIQNGHRVVAFEPEEAENSIYIFGDCNIFGIYNSDADTFPSRLQEMLTQAGYHYSVKNYGFFLFNYGIKRASIVAQISPKKGDIIVFEGEPSGVFDFPHLSMKNEILPTDLGEMFYDMAHYTPNLHKWMAEKFYNFFVENDFFKNFPERPEYKTQNIPLAGFPLTENAYGGG